jgi:hypothetical protein
MKNAPSPAHNKITPAQRGYVIQRIIVDGWTSAQAARSLGVPKRYIEAWVDEFRRSGMASLREGPDQTFPAEILRLTVMRPARMAWRKISTGVRRFFLVEPLVQPVPLRRSHKEGPR